MQNNICIIYLRYRSKNRKLSIRSNLPLTGISESKAEKNIIAPVGKGFKLCDDVSYPSKNHDCMHREGMKKDSKKLLFSLSNYLRWPLSEKPGVSLEF